MLTAGVLGASGYMGGEALRVLIEHPSVELAWATSRNPAPIESFHPNLAGMLLSPTSRSKSVVARSVTVRATTTSVERSSSLRKPCSLRSERAAPWT